MPHLARTHLPRVHLFLAASLVFSPVAGQAQDDTDASLGKEVFVELAEPQCAICHALADAGAAGDIGPDLDALKPTRERVSAAVTNGINAMPPYGEILTEAQIEAVADYVSTVAGRPGSQ